MGAIYWIMGIGLTLHDQWDAYIIVTTLFAGALMGYTYKQEKSARPVVLISSATHAAAQALAVILSARFFMHWNETHFALAGHWYSAWKWLGILLIEMGLMGFLVGSTLFGLNMLITCMCFRMNYNDAFSAFRLNRYNNFLRLRIVGDNIEIYAIGMDDVPSRDQWVANPKAAKGNPEEPVFVPKAPLKPHLIEKFTA